MKITKSKLLLIVLGALSLSIISPIAVSAATTDPCQYLTGAAREANGCDGNTKDGLSDAVMNIINWVLGIIALVAVVAIIIGGGQYMTSTGDPGKVKKAKDTILYAVIGLIVCALAAAIVNFVISATSGSAPTSSETEEAETK